MLRQSSYPRRRWPAIIFLVVCVGSAGLGLSGYAAGAETVPSDLVATAEPANPHASPEAKQLLRDLAQLPSRSENRVISGQHLSYHIRDTSEGYQTYIVDLQGSSAKWVAMIGVTYSLGATLSEIQQANRILIEHWNQGGLIMVDHHANNPWTGGSPWDLTSRNLEELITPGSAVNRVWMAELDKVAAGLAELRDAGVVVLWRPFHEMNYRECFWWDMGAVLNDHPGQGGQVWKNMWKHMFNYFSDPQGWNLNNLLWVYGPADASSAGWNEPDVVYPGGEYVDIVSLDVYSDTQMVQGDTYEQLLSLAKPFGFAEVGPGSVMDGTWDNMTIIDSIRDRYPKVTFFGNWHSWTDNQVAIVDNRNAAALLSDPWVITREDQDWRTAPTFTDVPVTHPYYAEIEALYRAGYIAGCATDPLRYCPDQTMNRAESAVFVERGIHGTDVLPLEPTTQTFADLPLDSWAAKWAGALWQDQYTAGCGNNPLIYCPWQAHTRAEGAVFFLRMLHGSGFVPEETTHQTFADVPLDTWYAKWVQAAYVAGLIPECQSTPELRFCPNDALSRGLAAYIMVRAKNLPMP